MNHTGALIYSGLASFFLVAFWLIAMHSSMWSPSATVQRLLKRGRTLFPRFAQKLIKRLGKYPATTVAFQSEANTWEPISTFPWDTRKATEDVAKLHADYFETLYKRPVSITHTRYASEEELPAHEERFPLLEDAHRQLQNYLIYGPGEGRKKPSSRIPQPVHTYTAVQQDRLPAKAPSAVIEEDDTLEQLALSWEHNSPSRRGRPRPAHPHYRSKKAAPPEPAAVIFYCDDTTLQDSTVKTWL